MFCCSSWMKLYHSYGGTRVVHSVVRLMAGWSRNHIWFPAGARYLLLSKSFNTNTAAHPAPFLMIIRGSFWHVNILGHPTDHSLLSNNEVKNKLSYKFTPQICLHSMHTDNFIFTFWPCYRNVGVVWTVYINTALQYRNNSDNQPLIYTKIDLPRFICGTKNDNTALLHCTSSNQHLMQSSLPSKD
jgi:hypothetical protein